LEFVEVNHPDEKGLSLSLAATVTNAAATTNATTDDDADD
jgi:hypothetical protein